MRIDTLWPEWTDSERASYHYLSSNGYNWEVFLHDTFEASVIEAANSWDENAKVIMPSAYPNIHRVFFDLRARLEEVFILGTMPMWLYENRGVRNNLIWIHPATSLLIDRIRVDTWKIVEFKAKQEALLKCSAGDLRYCIASVTDKVPFWVSLIQDFWSFLMSWNVFKILTNTPW